ncbi:hypothetical protein RclHR1_01480005 [Rhizophagus clarus]|uniref:Uncharacterized protein n=1 Tax=Rhizophagus clarus TaxID=94130 RepID=A0A2Z6QDF7_9GLOM|nr:hypothetical protein RclHR1_01480005 [Rhizophagus clarus]GET00890.1 hypothetical protein RCL_e2504_RclHR1_01480005 [Rhizophagus clarus]
MFTVVDAYESVHCWFKITITGTNFLWTYDFKSYEIIKHQGRNWLIAYFNDYETTETSRNALKSPFNLERQDYRWTRFNLMHDAQEKNARNDDSRSSKKQLKERRVPRLKVHHTSQTLNHVPTIRVYHHSTQEL